MKHKKKLSIQIVSQEKDKFNFKLTDRQKALLRIIIEQHSKTAKPIGSNVLKLIINQPKYKVDIASFFFCISPATIRNEMAFLEKTKLLIKEHTSSGRVPTKLGYEYYVENFVHEDVTNQQLEIANRLKKIFVQRNENIDVVLSETAKIVSEFINLPIVITKVTHNENEVLKKIDIANIVNTQFMIFLITSHSNIIKHLIEINNESRFKDIEACLRIFNENLYNVPINLISDKVEELTKSIRMHVYEYEFIFQEIIVKIINSFNKKRTNMQKNIYGVKKLVNQPEIIRKDLDLEKVLELLENSNIFTQLAYNHKNTGKTLINFNNELSGISVAANAIEDINTTHQITVVGPTRMDYLHIRKILDYLVEKISQKDDNFVSEPFK